MFSMLTSLVICIIVLALLFGGLCSITGEEKKGNTIVINCITAVILYLLVIQLFNTGLPNGGIFESGLPLVNNVENAGSVKEYLSKEPGAFALDFVELVAVILLTNWISNLFSFGEAGFVGKVITRIIIVLGGIIAYGFVMDMIRDNVVIRWCVYCVECIITGGSILYTPIMIVSFITGLKTNNPALIYFVEQFPKTSIGKAISTAVTTAIVFLVFLIVLESQYGSVCNIIKGTYDSMESIGAIVVTIFGIYIVVNSLKKKN